MMPKNGSSISRRQALVAVGSVVSLLYGDSISAEQSNAKGIALSLDAVDAVVLSYRGRKVVITPGEIMEALGQPVVPSPSQFAYPRKQ